MKNCRFLSFFEFYIDERESLVVVEEELEFPLEDGCTLFEEAHDSTTLEPKYEESLTLWRDMHNNTPMEP